MDSNLPLSEQFRIAAEHWADKEAAASLLEESKSAVLARRMAALGDVPVSHAERDVKSSAEWKQYIDAMCEARAEANKAKVGLEYIRVKFQEWQSGAADERLRARI